MFARLLLLLVLPAYARRVRAGPSRGLLEIEESLGSKEREAIAFRALEMEEHLKHSFLALPKNSRGVIGASIANYALHRWGPVKGQSDSEALPPASQLADEGETTLFITF